VEAIAEVAHASKAQVVEGESVDLDVILHLDLAEEEGPPRYRGGPSAYHRSGRGFRVKIIGRCCQKQPDDGKP
jgi:hypothetical protein